MPNTVPTIKMCNSQNKVQILSIYEYYVGISKNEMTKDVGLIQEVSEIMNEAMNVFNSRLTGDALLSLQVKFLSKYFPLYQLGNAKFPTDFDAFLKGCYITNDGNTIDLHHKTELFPEVRDNGFCYATLGINSSATTLVQNLKIVHESILGGLYRTGGKFVQN